MAYKYPDLIEYTCLNKKEYKAEDFKKEKTIWLIYNIMG
ncbi:hypothetical protein SACIG149_2534 [Staphylococcus aureus subsp. aureus CIG149]|nr:hypothetical protein SACIG149_2534 [Staphylococcus aureus subsp. aureus CIG149]